MKKLVYSILGGLLIGSTGYAKSVCERNIHVEEALVQKVGKPCDQITALDLAKIDVLVVSLEVSGARRNRNFDFKKQVTLQKGDFAGLDTLKSLVIYIQGKILRPNVFAGVPSLKSLTFEGANMGALVIYDKAFAGLDNLTLLRMPEVDLYDQAKKRFTVTKSFLSQMPKLHRLSLQIWDANVESGLFSSLPDLKYVKISATTHGQRQDELRRNISLENPDVSFNGVYKSGETVYTNGQAGWGNSPVLCNGFLCGEF